MRLANLLVVVTGPPTCAGCARRGTWLCSACEIGLLRPAAAAPPPGVTRIGAAYEYAGAARTLVLSLKLRSRRGAAEPLARGMAGTARHNGLRGSFLTWVPGRGRDIRARGYDHAAELAACAARLLGLPTAPLLTRSRPVADQSGLGAAARATNLAGAFAARRSPPDVVLVDDLVTTGATASACAGALRDAGAETVELLSACRKS